MPKTKFETDTVLPEAPPTGRKTHCIEDLQRRILTQELEPGSYLDEVEVAQRYGISRPPVREALRQLVGEGYVLLHENRGAQVAPMNHKSLRNFFIAAPMIYAAVAQLAARNATPDQIERLRQIQATFRDAIANGDARERAFQNQQFHAAMGEAAGNEYLVPSLRRLLIDHTRIGMTFYDPLPDGSHAEEQQIAANQHDQFIDLIAARDSESAGNLAVAHFELSRVQIERFVVPESLQIPLEFPVT